MTKMKTTSAKKILSSGYFPVSVKASMKKLKDGYRTRATNNETVDSLLKTLVAFPTVSDDSEANRGAIKYVGRYLKAAGMYIEYREWDGKPALWATTRPHQKHPRILLAAHMDVIPANKDMFNLRVEGDRYYGRGTMDMKSAIAAYMKAISNLEGPLSHYDFGVMITSDEELGGKDGVNAVIQYLTNGYGADFVILPDGGNNWSFEESSKGYLHYTFESVGKAAHGSRPWEGDNALVRLTRVLHELQDEFMDQGPDTSTINVGAVMGGEVANKIPGHASAEISFRPIDQKAMIDLAKLTKKICKQHGVRAHLRASFNPLQHSFDEPHFKALFDVVAKVRGKRPKGMRSHAGSDARHFSDAGIPVAVFYPNGNGHHSDHEWVERKSLHEMEDIFTYYLQLHSV
jgi:succinyl-diaminopimelate desuccinylase